MSLVAGLWTLVRSDLRLAPIERAIEAIRAGEMIVVVDDEDRENEGDLIMAAEAVTPEKIAFFLAHTSGLICVALTGARCDQLALPLMVEHNTERQRTAFTHSVDAREGTTTGISAHDRATTIATLANPGALPGDLVRPGHIFPLRAVEGGVLRRTGHTEAATDLPRLAGLQPAGVLSEVVDEKKTGMARLPELLRFADSHDLVIVSIADLVRHRRRSERLVERVAESRIPTPWGQFTCIAYTSSVDGATHLAFVMGEVEARSNVLVRVHSECLTGDVFGSLRCDCGEQLRSAMKQIAAAGEGVIVYLRGHEGRGIGIANKLRAYVLQDNGRDTVDANLDLGLHADSREYGTGAQILVDLGVSTMRLLTNNPAKREGLAGFGLEITERVPLEPPHTDQNIDYLRTKRDRLGHLMVDLDDDLG